MPRDNVTVPESIAESEEMLILSASIVLAGMLARGPACGPGKLVEPAIETARDLINKILVREEYH